MGKKVTISDIAKKTGVSAGTVHRAIYNKKGVGAELRLRIMEEVAQTGYQVNKAASALKRKLLTIAVVAPEPVGASKFYFQYILQGIRDAENELTGMNVNLRYFPTDYSLSDHLAVLKTLEEDGGYDGIVTQIWDEPELLDALNRFLKRGVPIVILNLDLLKIHEHPILYTHTGTHGILAGELMSLAVAKRSGKIIALSGDRKLYKLRDATNAFIDTLYEHNSSLQVYDIHEFRDDRKIMAMCEEYLTKFDDIIGIYAASSRETYIVCRVVQRMKLSGKFTIIGSDVFEEILPFLDDGTLTATIYQHPHEQGYRAIKLLYDFLSTGSNEREEIQIPCSIVMKSNARFFV